MELPKIALEAKCLILLTGGVLERRIENRAQELADGREADEIATCDVKKAIEAVFEEELSDLPHHAARAIERFERLSTKVA